MEQVNGSNTLTSDLLKKLAQAEGPCVTIILRADAQNDLRTQLKNAVHQVEGKLGGAGDQKALLAPLLEETEPVPVAQRPIGSLVFLRSADVFVKFFTPLALAPVVEAGDFFQISRLLPVVESTKEFYLLALSQNRARLLLCSSSSSVEVALPQGTPTSLMEAMQTRQPDHTLDGRAAGGPSMGSMKGVMFGTSSEKEHKPEDLHHYFKAIDKGVHTLLHGLNVPLVAAAVERELAIYRSVNTYPHLVEPGIHGSPDGMKGGEMHKRALELLQSHLDDRVEKALHDFDKSVGTGHGTADSQEIAAAAREGRISHLFLKDDDGSNDLNEEVIETMKHGGRVSSIAAEKMPNGAAACAVLRYATVGVAG